MAKYKKRVEWGVRLQHYNLKEGDDLHPRAVLRGTLDVHDLALILEENSRGIYRAADTELIVNQLMSVARDALVDGYALNTPMGRLTRRAWYVEFQPHQPCRPCTEPGIALLRFEHRTEKSIRRPSLPRRKLPSTRPLHLRYTRYGEWHAQ